MKLINQIGVGAGVLVLIGFPLQMIVSPRLEKVVDKMAAETVARDDREFRAGHDGMNLADYYRPRLLDECGRHDNLKGISLLWVREYFQRAGAERRGCWVRGRGCEIYSWDTPAQRHFLKLVYPENYWVSLGRLDTRFSCEKFSRTIFSEIPPVRRKRPLGLKGPSLGIMAETTDLDLAVGACCWMLTLVVFGSRLRQRIDGRNAKCTIADPAGMERNGERSWKIGLRIVRTLATAMMLCILLIAAAGAGNYLLKVIRRCRCEYSSTLPCIIELPRSLPYYITRDLKTGLISWGVITDEEASDPVDE